MNNNFGLSMFGLWSGIDVVDAMHADSVQGTHISLNLDHLRTLPVTSLRVVCRRTRRLY